MLIVQRYCYRIMTRSAFRLLAFPLKLCPPLGTVSWENEGWIYGTKEVCQPSADIYNLNPAVSVVIC